jgi:dephospho-CoA kinase
VQNKNTLYILGLTGSIGAGKSETARMFKRLHVPVSEADTIVRKLYEDSSLFQEKLSALFPHESVPLSRFQVASLVMRDPFLLYKLEKIIHPFVREEHDKRIQSAREKGERLIVLDIPLLFETGWKRDCDGVLVVTCRPEVQKKRVMSRQGMTEEKFELFQKRQWEQEKKCARADFILDTTEGRLHTFRQLRRLLEKHCKG